MKIELCMGSACHVRGSKNVLEALKTAISKNKLDDKVSIAGTICLGQCKSGGVNMKIDGELVTGVKMEEFDTFFTDKVKKPLGL